MRESAISQKLAFLQLSDSFFPSGSFTLSHGLEYLVQNKQIQTRDDLKVFLQLLLKYKIGTSDLVALIYAYKASKDNNIDRIRLADRRLFIQTLIETNRKTQRQSGRALLMVASSTWQHHQLDILQEDIRDNKINCLYPIIFAVVAQIAGMNEEDTAISFLHSLVTSLLSAAIRLGIIGHLSGQNLLLELRFDIEDSYQKAINMSLEDMFTCTPSIDMAQMKHQQLDRKIFTN